MTQFKRLLLLLLLLAVSSGPIRAQVQEAMQLALNIQKLAQLKKILTNMYDGYKVVSGGYNKVKEITSGNYKVHQVFLDGLMIVNPKIRSYRRVADIVQYQAQLLKEYKNAYSRFRQSDLFSTGELGYMAAVYQQLIDESLGNLDELLVIVSASKLRMTDDERLEGIDRIYFQMQDKLSFLRSFNNKSSLLCAQRDREQKDAQNMQILYDLK